MSRKILLSDAIDEYLDVSISSKAPGTLPALRSSLKSFLTDVGNIYTKSLDVRHVERWLISNRHWAASTRAVMIGRVSGFMNWMRRRNYLEPRANPMDGIGGGKIARKPRLFIPRHDFGRVLDVAGESGPRDRIITALGLFLMVRASEMRLITWGDVDEEIAVYRSKVYDYDDLPISRDLAAELATWRNVLCRNLEVTAPDPRWYVMCRLTRADDRNEDGTFVGSRGGGYLPDQPLVRPLLRIKPILARAGYGGAGVGMHTLRRSGAQAMLEHMMDSGLGRDRAFDTVRDMLGHGDVHTTMVYLDWQTNRKRRNQLVRDMTLLEPEGGEVIELKGNRGEDRTAV